MNDEVKTEEAVTATETQGPDVAAEGNSVQSEENTVDVAGSDVSVENVTASVDGDAGVTEGVGTEQPVDGVQKDLFGAPVADTQEPQKELTADEKLERLGDHAHYADEMIGVLLRRTSILLARVQVLEAASGNAGKGAGSIGELGKIDDLGKVGV